MAHLVNKLEFEVHCPDEDQAFNMRHNFAQTFQQQVESVIEKICTQYVEEGEWLQIDKLEIDMGRLSPYSLDRDFEQVFSYSFEKQLIEKLAAFSVEQRNYSALQSRLELLQHFLQNGVLPWWADEGSINLEQVCNDVFSNAEGKMRQFFFAAKR